MMKKLLIFALALACALSVASCAAGEDAVSVATLSGPTGMGMAHMMAQNDGTYAFNVATAPDQLAAALISGACDIAAVPTNLAATLYQKTKGGVKMLAVNTLGVLYVLERGDSVHTLADLEGKTVTLAGQGATPEYALAFALSQSGVSATLDFKTEHAEVSALAASGLADIVLLPEPHVTALLMKDAGFRVALPLTEAFAEAAEKAGMPGGELTMGCVVARTEFFENHPEAVSRFMTDCAASVAFAGEDPEKAAAEIAAVGILPSEKIALAALPKCQLVFITGEDMQSVAAPFLAILHGANPASVGGALPDEGLYAE